LLSHECSSSSPFLHAEAFHHRGHAVGGGEVAHQVVLEGDEELRAAGVALAGAAAAELAVDAARFVAFGADDEEAAEFGHAGPSLMSVPRPAMLVETVTARAGRRGRRFRPPARGISR
jgi:hypothetical protein